MGKNVRVRFAPSPTGGLQLGGVRTLLYNYLFARHHNGTLVLRIEDTDQTRFVEGAEDYIYRTLEWCGLQADESPVQGGSFGPYRQSERKSIYGPYAQQLIEAGKAYYAFDTPEELESMRLHRKSADNPSPQYDHRIRLTMRNSLSLPPAETKRLLAEQTPYVIRILMPRDESVSFTDMIRGLVSFQTASLDDKVLIKADGMPTYHLAVVVDDYLMQISHSFRGEEWLPSAPAHILLWRYLFGERHMPEWAHFPLILKPNGNGKLSKRDADRLGMPIFSMDWTDPKTGELIEGFKEKGFLPEAFLNMLAMLGWNEGGEKEIFSMEELIEKFTIERVHKHGAKFDYEKAKWYNQEWIRKIPAKRLLEEISLVFAQQGIDTRKDNKLPYVIALVKDRCSLLGDFFREGNIFFEAPRSWDMEAILPKWTDQKRIFFAKLSDGISLPINWDTPSIESLFKELAVAQGLKPGELQLPFRIMLVGEKKGPPVFEIARVLGPEQTRARIDSLLGQL